MQSGYKLYDHYSFSPYFDQNKTEGLNHFTECLIKYFEYSAKIEAGHYPGTHNFYAVYFTMTGLHGIHILGGIVVNYYLWKSFATQAIERTSKWLNIATLFCLLLPWSSTGDIEDTVINGEVNVRESSSLPLRDSTINGEIEIGTKKELSLNFFIKSFSEV